MKRFTVTRVLILVVLAVLAAPVHAGDPQVKDPPGDGGGSGSCTYCGQAHCGCATIPGYHLSSFSCACTATDCLQDCQYEPN
jgi:hypothetical protein